MNNNHNFSGIVSEQPLLTPKALNSILPLDEKLIKAIYEARQTISAILHGKEQRLLVIVGPCSLHDEAAALEYAEKLKKAAEQYQDELFIIMRAYFAKPRSTQGWKGMVYDPFLDGSHRLEEGLLLTRQLLIKINRLLPIASEFLDLLTPCYLNDLLSWCAIGARTSASQTHRELASGLGLPAGFKNSVDGNIQTAIDAAQAASSPHYYLGPNSEGQPALIQTQGNPDSHVILRGSLEAPNYSAEHIRRTTQALEKAALEPRLIIDCSHGNCGKEHERQIQVIDALIPYLQTQAAQVTPLCGIMLESHLESGKQPLAHPQQLIYGQSITDPCLSWAATLPLLEKLAMAMRAR